MTRQTLIVGIGSPYGDDRAGWDVANGLKDRLVKRKCQVRIAQSPLDLLSWIDGVDRLIICDACRSGGKVGEVQRFRWPDLQLAQSRWSGTHDFSVVATVELAERLGRLPGEVIWFAVEAAVADPAAAMSPQVSRAIGRMVQLVSAEMTTGDSLIPETNSCTNSR